MLPKLINVGILDDHIMFRKTLKNYLCEIRNLNVVIQSSDIPDLLNKLKQFQVHILLMDIFMPNLNGAEALKLIKEEYPEIKILILSTCTDMELLSNLLDLGVYGIVSKADEPEELIHAITSLSEGKLYRSTLLTEVIYWNKQTNIKKGLESLNITLSDREIKILQLLWEEKSNKEIASELYLSVRSIEKIRQDMKEKLQTKSTIGLLKYAIQKRIIGTNAYVMI
jgi:DNA-binding NarL/FixJ family response regulator